ncbi:hypothetical protein GIB67_025619 [Kingdonia uniflora]|uniref:Uncharacterized protein n=1 Tax=Kingdonia uniflora TaxID=39325 RepID=A0A7J7L8L3_9MAGN|nr:hypothetical protein GIB67_025619 [Kingdonia uniflora]
MVSSYACASYVVPQQGSPLRTTRLSNTFRQGTLQSRLSRDQGHGIKNTSTLMFKPLVSKNQSLLGGGLYPLKAIARENSKIIDSDNENSAAALFESVQESSSLVDTEYESSTPIISENVNSKPVVSDPSLFAFISKKLSAVSCFVRLFTMTGLVTQILAMAVLPVTSIAEITPQYFGAAIMALIPMLLINAFVAGVNELFDIEIDKINKPHLPLASGELSIPTAIAITAGAALTALAMGFSQSPALLCAVLVFFIVGGAYSIDLPFLRWKNSSVLAAMCMTMFSALGAQLFPFLHFQRYVLQKPVVFTRSIIFATAFMCIFMPLIALYKDIPDTEGDRAHGVKSLSIHLGKEKVFNIVITSLLAMYGASAMVGLTSPILLNRIVFVLGHTAIASFVWFRSRSVDVSNRASLSAFYMVIWKLLSAEYLLIPFC